MSPSSSMTSVHYHNRHFQKHHHHHHLYHIHHYYQHHHHNQQTQQQQPRKQRLLRQHYHGLRQYTFCRHALSFHSFWSLIWSWCSFVSSWCVVPLVGHFALYLVLVTGMIGLSSFWPDAGAAAPRFTGMVAYAHAPPRINRHHYYETSINPIRMALASAAAGSRGSSGFVRSFPVVNSYYNTRRNNIFNRNNNPENANVYNEKSMATESKGRSLIDPYYFYDLHHETNVDRGERDRTTDAVGSLPIPSCKELRLMWLAKQFARFHSAYQASGSHQANGGSNGIWQHLKWASQIPELRQLIDAILKQDHKKQPQKQQQTNSEYDSDAQSVMNTEIEKSVAPKSSFIDDDRFVYDRSLLHKPVYIAKIVPSTNSEQKNVNIPKTAGKNRSQADETMTFGIIHNSPDDGDDDQEELISNNSNMQKATQSIDNEIQKQKDFVADGSISANIDAKGMQRFEVANGNQVASFGKFLDNNNNNNNNNELKTINSSKAYAAQKTTNERKWDSPKAGLSSSSNSRSRFQKNPLFPGVFHNGPVKPSVRIV